MSLLARLNWLRVPTSRELIAHNTVGGADARHELALPPPREPERLTFLALGDTGDSDSVGHAESPQDAVGRELATDAALPGSAGAGELVIHVGDVIYMAGERRLYDRNFRRPYAPFLTPDSTVDHLVFRLPYLPVPGNHDTYDLSGWVKWVSRVPLVGAGLKALTHALFAFSVPEDGSHRGQVFLNAFVDVGADGQGPLAYQPGQATRLPNRYYRCRYGPAEFFALDSNTLLTPVGDPQTVRRSARERVAELRRRADELDGALREQERKIEAFQRAERQATAEDPERRRALLSPVACVASALTAAREALAPLASQPEPCRAVEAVTTADRAWQAAGDRLRSAHQPAAVVAAMANLERADGQVSLALRSLESCLASMPEGPERAAVLAARDDLEEVAVSCATVVSPVPKELHEQVARLSEEALDVQRHLASASQRLRYRPEDHDADQLAWLERSLTESVAERPEAWRIVYLHHPLYTTINNHCEESAVRLLRQNLQGLLAGRAHLVLAGHAHAFEWLRAGGLPYAGLFVTGGGGQISLRRSVVDPRVRGRYLEAYQRLREAGVAEVAVAGRGPIGDDGAAGSLYHYLRIEVLPDRLRVIPVGVRRLAEGFRREEPMPVFWARELPAEAPPWQRRHLAAVEIFRDRPPQPVWG